jgi:hypothetical protein
MVMVTVVIVVILCIHTIWELKSWVWNQLPHAVIYAAWTLNLQTWTLNLGTKMMWGSDFHVYIAGRNLTSRKWNLLKVGYMGFCLGLQKNEPKIWGSLTSVTGKSIPWTGPEVSRGLRLPDFRQSAREGGKVVSCTNWLPLHPRKYSWYSFLFEAESTPRLQCNQRDYVRQKFQLQHWESNLQPSSLWHTAPTNCTTTCPVLYQYSAVLPVCSPEIRKCVPFHIWLNIFFHTWNNF